MNTAHDYLVAGAGTVADITEPLYAFARRAAILRRLLPCAPEDLFLAIEDGWPSMYSGSEAARQKGINRDLYAMGARFIAGEWRLPEAGR